jgi:hypothetical protein
MNNIYMSKKSSVSDKKNINSIIKNYVVLSDTNHQFIKNLADNVKKETGVRVNYDTILSWYFECVDKVKWDEKIKILKEILKGGSK